ncbi:hypothetical protein LOK49_LG02G01350 [Camellia lanceoleosa]|uniref:Uncharacterized protein n=1 Tax=Camellia lanceoleosa TaxID=1840588 RepID=A0ACC0IRQ8_9ERIC|nr:hypothetical protein LOK49_LG02G01350 [Camellia lanceoleosa]
MSANSTLETQTRATLTSASEEEELIDSAYREKGEKEICRTNWEPKGGRYRKRIATQALIKMEEFPLKKNCSDSEEGSSRQARETNQN